MTGEAGVAQKDPPGGVELGQQPGGGVVPRHVSKACQIEGGRRRECQPDVRRYKFGEVLG